MTDQHSAETASSKAAEFKAKFEALKERATTVALSVQAAVPVTERPLAAQEAFLLTFADLKLVETLLEKGGEALKGVDASVAAEAGEDSLLASLAERIADAMMEEFGVAKQAIMPAILKDLDRQLVLIESVVVRMEASQKVMAA